MGTRGVIARLTKSGFKGRYHNWDSYPTGLGLTLVKLYNEHFNKDLKAMLKVLIDDHKAGWSTINDKDFNLTAGYESLTTEDYNNKTEAYKRPQCYCHGERSERGQLITEKNASDCGCEYGYVFNVKQKIMYIISSYTQKGEKMIGMFGFGDLEAEWRIIKTIKLDEDSITEEDLKNLEV